MGGREGGVGGPFPTPLLFCSWQGSVGFLGSGVPERVKLIPRDMMAQANWGHLEDAGDLKFPQSTSLTGRRSCHVSEAAHDQAIPVTGFLSWPHVTQPGSPSDHALQKG